MELIQTPRWYSDKHLVAENICQFFVFDDFRTRLFVVVIDQKLYLCNDQLKVYDFREETKLI